MRKKLFLSLLALALMATVVAWRTIGAELVTSYLGYVCGETLGATLTKGGVELTGESYTLHGVHVDREEGGSLHFSAEKISCRYVVHPFSLTLDLDIAIDRPTLSIGEELDIAAIVERVKGLKGIFFVRPNVVVDGGTILLGEEGKRLFFSTNFDYRDRESGTLAMSFGDPEFKSNAVEIALRRDRDMAFAVEAALRNLDLAGAAESLEPLFPMLKEWQVRRGHVDGQFSVGRRHGKRLQASGEASLSDLFVANEGRGFEALLSSLSLDFSGSDAVDDRNLGFFSIGGESALSLKEGGKMLWQMKNIAGGLRLEKHGNAVVKLVGDCLQQGEEEFGFQLRGAMRLFDEVQTATQLSLETTHSDKKNGNVEIVVKKINDLWNSAEIAIHNIGAKEVTYLQTLASAFTAKAPLYRLHEGFIKGSATAYFQGARIHSLKIGSLELNGILFDYFPYQLYGDIDRVVGGGSVNFSKGSLTDSLNVDFLVEEGSLWLVGMERELCQLGNISTKISFKNGVIQNSTVYGTFAGLRGTIEVDWHSPEELVKLHFSGSSKGLIPLLPRSLQRGVTEKFSSDNLAFNASLQKRERGFYAEGIVEVKERLQSREQAIAFGFDLERLFPHLLQRESASSGEKRQWQRLNDSALNLLLPALASPMLQVREQWQRQNEGISGFLLKKGWLYGEKLPLDKYVAPFLLLGDGEGSPSTLTGMGNFHGSYDHTGFSASYTAKDVVFDTADFRIDVDTIDQQPIGDGDEMMIASHHLDFASGHHFGKIPIRHATYLDKHSGLLFREVDTLLVLEGKRVHATDIECFCQGIFFAGDINVEIFPEEKEAYDVEIVAHTMSGKVSQVQSLFAHFDKPPLLTGFPLEGDMLFRKEGGALCFSVRPEGTSVKTRFSATLSDGNLSLKPLDLSLQELGLDIEYDQEKNRFTIDNIQGTLLVGKPGSVEEYSLSGEEVAFSDFSGSVSTFDLWLGDKSREIVRLKGSSRGERGGDGAAERVTIVLDEKLSHFGEMHPTNFFLHLKEWEEVEEFELNLFVDLNSLFDDIKRASRSAIFPLPEELFKTQNNLEQAKGDFIVKAKYNNASSSFNYDIVGMNVEIGSHGYKNIALSGSMKGGVWSVDQLLLDDLSLAAEIYKLSDRWRINFLGLKSGKSAVMGLEGDFFPRLARLDAKVKLLEISLDDLGEWPQLQEFVAGNTPSGTLKGSGDLTVERVEGRTSVNGIFTMSGERLQLKGAALSDTNNFSAHFVSGRGLTLRNITTHLLPPFNREPSVAIAVEKIAFDLNSDRKEYEGIRLHIPNRSLGWFADELQRLFPNEVADGTVEIIRGLKKNGDIGAVVNLSLFSKEDFSLALYLDDDSYSFGDSLHEVKNFSLHLSPKELNIGTIYRYKRKEFWVDWRCRELNFDSGTFYLTDIDEASRKRKEETIAVKWERHPDYGFTIIEAKGRMGGIELNLARDWQYSYDPNYSYLFGKAKVELPKALLFCSDELIEGCQKQKIGGRYTFDGKIALAKDGELSHRMIGNLLSSDLVIKGYLFNRFSCLLDYKSDAILLKDLAVEDPSGYLSIKEGRVNCTENGEWWMNIPLLTVKKFRPSLLQEVVKGAANGAVKPFLFNAIEVNSLTGNVADTESWRGSGFAKFSNPPKTNFQNTIFALPHEIIMRLGLNPTVLTPVTGTLFFDIAKSKLFFTKFKDIYSQSRGSKFYLVGAPGSSFVDFEGNLHVNVRMKQYNLLFKIAELFIFNIKGTVYKPVYSLKQERNKNHKKGNSL